MRRTTWYASIAAVWIATLSFASGLEWLLLRSDMPAVISVPLSLMLWVFVAGALAGKWSYGSHLRRDELMRQARAITEAGGLGASAAASDRAAADQLRREFGDKAVIELDDVLFVRARLRPDADVSQADLDRMYTRFFLFPDGRRRDSRFMYLNVYDPAGRFLVQLRYDADVQAITRSETELL